MYSYQFEFGPLSEASIGNVGLRPHTTGWVDHVVTPGGALGFMVAEDALDRYLIVRIEWWTGNRFLRAAARMALNPSRTLSNTAQGHNTVTTEVSISEVLLFRSTFMRLTADAPDPRRHQSPNTEAAIYPGGRLSCSG